MKKITIASSDSCPYCRKAERLIERVLEREPKYAGIEIETIGREEAAARNLKVTLLPTFYINEEKIFEGYLTVDILRSMLDLALSGSSDETYRQSRIKEIERLLKNIEMRG